MIASVSAVLVVLASTCPAAKAPWPPTGEIAWECEYTADVEPAKAIPAWRPSHGEHTDCKVERGVLRIRDRSSQHRSLHCYTHPWYMEPEHGAVVEARVKVINNNARSGICLMAADGEHEVGITLYPDKVSVAEGPEVALSTTDDYHVYRLALRGDDYHVWVDGKLVIDGTGKHTRQAHRGRNVTTFGSISSKAVSEALWDVVRYKVFGRRPAPPRLAGATDVVVYKKDGVYACFPSLRKLGDGSLITSFGTRVRRSHIDPTGGSARRISKDGGKTWQPYKGKLPPPPEWTCSDGSLAYARAYGWRQVPESRRDEFAEKGITVRPVKPGVVAYLQGAFARRSTDGGKTWKTTQLDLPPHESLMNFNSSQSIRMACGVLLCAPYGKLKDDEKGRTFILRSEDCGKTWTFGPLAKDPTGRARLNECALVENDRGEVVAMIRSEPPAGGHLFHAISKDKGKTWSTGRRTKIWGYPANLIKLHDNRILCTYGYRRGAMGVRAVLSKDGGHTWDTDNIIVLRNDHWGVGGDLGYPISVELAPGKVFTIYYITLTDGVTHIAGTHWTVP